MFGRKSIFRILFAIPAASLLIAAVACQGAAPPPATQGRPGRRCCHHGAFHWSGRAFPHRSRLPLGRHRGATHCRAGPGA